jgi:hypothetical protein
MKAVLQRICPWSVPLWTRRPDLSGSSSTGEALEAWQIIVAILGIAGPLALGSLVGQAGIGTFASFGGLAMSGTGSGQTFREQAIGMAYALIAGSMAMFLGSIMNGQGVLTSFGIPALAALAGVLGGISRLMVRASIQFTLYVIIAAHLGDQSLNPLAAMLIFSLGAVWTAILTLVLRPVFWAVFPSTTRPASSSPSPKYSAAQLLRRWRRSLCRLSGWQYTIRITLCLAAAQALQWLWPHPRAYWVSLTVVLVIQRMPMAALQRTLQRAAGTALGVALTCIFLLGMPSGWVLITIIAALAAMNRLLRQVNYAAYTAVMTPLIILLLDFGQEVSGMVIAVRLAATLAGCLLALTLGCLPWSRYSLPAHQAGGSSSVRPHLAEMERVLQGSSQDHKA